MKRLDEEQKKMDEHLDKIQEEIFGQFEDIMELEVYDVEVKE